MLDGKLNFSEIEKEMQTLWKEQGTFRFDPDKKGEVYSIDTPPPTVSGKLHIGHIFSYTQAEMVARYRRLKGNNVYYPFGFDDNGLPTERLVEKEQGIYAKSMPRKDFSELCKKTVVTYENQFRNLWDTMGFSVDWSLTYETINPVSQRISQRSFLELAKKGNAYLKEKPVLWCTVCQTSIAQAELEAKEVETTFNHIYFYIGKDKIEIATTRPEFLYGCVALLFHPEDKRAKKYAGKKARVPLYNFEVPVMFDEKVDREKGSGVVMCCTFGDSTDLEWYEKYNLPYKKVLEADGRVCEGIQYIGGMKVKPAREAIIEKLKESGDFISQETIMHNVNVHERCGTGVEILPSNQWYINILEHKQRYLEAADEIKWYPEHMKNRYTTWVENLKWDWCISRQRFFGVPFPVWYCKSCGKAIFAEDSQLPCNPLEDKPLSACSCGCNEFAPDADVMDTWATSSVSPLINARWGEKDCKPYLSQMTMRTQAHEIIRTWAFYTIVKSLYHTGQVPWKDIMICGFVLAKRGSNEKISKSKGNSSAEPAELIRNYGADAVRYWAANSRLGTDTFFSEDEIKQSGRFLTKLWNAAKFSLMQLNGFDGKKPAKLMPADEGVLSRFAEMQKRYCDYLDEYEVGLAKHELDSFFWSDYCDNYLEIAKERLYQPDKHGEANTRSGQYTVYTLLLEMLKMYSIFVPHITEKIYQSYYSRETGDSVATVGFGKIAGGNGETGFWDALKEIVGAVRKAKTERGVSMKEPVSLLKVKAPKEYIPALKETLGDLTACTTADKIEITEGELSTEVRFAG